MYLSFLRYPLFILFGRKKEDYRWVSGVPLFGNLAILLGLWHCSPNIWLSVGALLAIAADTAGLPWFIACVWRDKSFWESPTWS
jgi:hypothetical protein